jgi:EAL domain-containing protein (putative c-di-GMP-specific phosphodiesterase class I)
MATFLPIRAFFPGDTLFRQGDLAECAYIIDEGEVDVIADRQGESEVVARIGPGQFLGEMAMLDAQPRSATAIARTRGSLTILAREQLTSRLREADPVVRYVVEVLLDRLRGQLSRSSRTSANLPPVSLPTQGQLRVIERIKLESELRVAMGDGQMRLFVQPIAECKTRLVRGFEALVRWEHPQRGTVAPDLFIKVAEECGLIVPLGRWITHEACLAAQRFETQANRAQVQGKQSFMSINVSGGQFHDPDFLPFLAQSMRESGVDPQRIKLEITESILIDAPFTQNWISEAKGLGVKVVLDDFGTGYSSLSYLHKLSFDALKIDQSFIRRMSSDPKAEKIVKAIVVLAQALGLQTIAEGVETEEQLQRVDAFGCNFAQGYFLSKPIPVEAVIG